MATSSLITEQGAIDVSFPSSGDLSSHQYKAMVLDSSEEVALAGANAKVFGILQNAPSAQGETARLRIQGVSKLIVAEAVTTGKFITSTAAGLGEVCDAANEEYFCVAMGDFATSDHAEVIIARGEVTASDA